MSAIACAATSTCLATSTVTSAATEKPLESPKKSETLSSLSEESFPERKDGKQQPPIPISSVAPRSYSMSSSSTEPPPSRSRPRCRTPQCSQFASQLTRCRQCKKAKQGAVFCRVVRMHREDGWEAPAGFEEWLMQYNASQEASGRSRAISGGGKRRAENRSLHHSKRRRRIRDREELVWKPPDSMTDDEIDKYLATVDAPEDMALEALRAADYDATKVELPRTNERKLPPVPIEDETREVFAAACFLLCGGSDSKESTNPEMSSARKTTRRWTHEDVHRFGEALLECDRDCYGALKKMRRRCESFANADVGDVLDLYYGLFKASGARYEDWKSRLRGRRGPTIKNQEADKFLLQSDDVFDCPCGCGGVVDNRGRPSSHRRKWATRSCRDRAARAAAAAGGGNAASKDDELSGGEVSSSSGGEIVSTSGRAAASSSAPPIPSQRSKRRTAATSQAASPTRPRAHSATTEGSNPSSSSKDRSRRPTLIRRGLIFAVEDECFRVEGRSSSGDGWLVRWIGGPRQGEVFELTAVSVASRASRSVVVAEDADDGRKPSYRGVTKKGSDKSCSSRYNAAFSLLGDRFSLGAFETAVDAARAWDVVAWASGRDDLNVSSFKAPKPTPSKSELQSLANTLRDAVRLRARSLSDLDEDDDLDAVVDGELVRGRDRSAGGRRRPAPPQKRSGGGLPGILYASCLERLADEQFTVGLGSATASDGRVFVVTARLPSQKWLVECFQGETLVEMSVDDLQKAGGASFALLSRGIVEGTDCQETVSAVEYFCKDQLVDKRLSDGRVIKDVVISDDSDSSSSFSSNKKKLVARTVSPDGSTVDLDLLNCRRHLLNSHRAAAHCAARLLLAPNAPADNSEIILQQPSSAGQQHVSDSSETQPTSQQPTLGGLCLLPPLSVA